MKTNEAPEKIYVHRTIHLGLLEASEMNITGCDIEYIRTDAFIEKALKWYCLDCECNNNCHADHKCFFRQEYKRYLEGNDNAVPPKFDDAILPDEDAAENYRYRHYIRKMQDAFIEKACDAYCKVCGHYAHKTPNHICRQTCDYYDNFRTLIKGE